MYGTYVAALSSKSLLTGLGRENNKKNLRHRATAEYLVMLQIESHLGVSVR